MDKLKAVLQEKKKQILDNIKNNIEPQMSHTVSFVDPLDFAANESAKNVLGELKHKDLQTVKKIDIALIKFSGGTYGLCEACEEDIEEKRLNAQPWVALCLSCQETSDHRAKRFSGDTTKNTYKSTEDFFDGEGEAS